MNQDDIDAVEAAYLCQDPRHAELVARLHAAEDGLLTVLAYIRSAEGTFTPDPDEIDRIAVVALTLSTGVEGQG